ncbi:hypothetical protein PR048_013354 [Dryococelus australis]|uniref:Uncharacterized protein n=1 Tax=Dryococelus australis TaxID=614101 RepID=A0ABQ9HSR4_9NEOP|nr:hypothetical protein PR048_013354 [Dryococelus australis]
MPDEILQGCRLPLIGEYTQELRNHASELESSRACRKQMEHVIPEAHDHHQCYIVQWFHVTTRPPADLQPG